MLRKKPTPLACIDGATCPVILPKRLVLYSLVLPNAKENTVTFSYEIRRSRFRWLEVLLYVQRHIPVMVQLQGYLYGCILPIAIAWWLSLQLRAAPTNIIYKSLHAMDLLALH